MRTMQIQNKMNKTNLQESTFDLLQQEIDLGIQGKNEAIPIGLKRLGKYANIRPRILTLLFSTSGAGKSSMMDTIILNACDSHMSSPVTNKLKPDFQLFSMERSKLLRIAKWTSFIIFRNEGVEIPVPKLLGWWDEKLTKEEYSLVLKQKEYIDCLLNDYVTIYEGAKSPNEFYSVMKTHLESKGTYDKIIRKGKEYKAYIKNNDNEIVIPVIDHGNLIKTTQVLPSKKQAIDKTVEMVQGFRDLESCSPFWVAQVNRSISSVSRLKDNEHELMLEDVKESGDVGDACDLALSLYDPIKYGQSSKTGYKPIDFIDKSDGSNYFRSIQILKSTYGQDSLRIPLAFNGFCGQFKELPKRNSMSESEYPTLVENVLNKSYFLT